MDTREDLFDIRPVGPGRYALEGELSFASAGQALQKTAKMFTAQAAVVFDLAGIVKADSAGLALLLEWLRQADSGGAELRYAKLPGQLSAMAQVAGVDGILIID
jgi:phospholipid transport system transporter-binding protein